MAALVDDIGAWVAIAVGLCVVLGSFYGATKWARKQLKDAVTDDVKPSLEHLHDCVERITAAVAVQADAAASAAADAQYAARKAQEAADEAKDAVQHITEWQAKVDIDLKNIQQMRVTFPEQGGA